MGSIVEVQGQNQASWPTERWKWAWRTALWLALVCCQQVAMANTVGGHTVSGQTTAPTGSYTITFSPCPSGTRWGEVFQNGVKIASYSQYNCTGSMSLSGKSPGTYTYEYQTCENDVTIGLLCVPYPRPSHTVSVPTISVPTSFSVPPSSSTGS